MFKSLSTLKKILVVQEKYLRGRWSIATLFAIVASPWNLATPSQYLFGYLYTGPILLANSRLSRLGKLQFTLVAASFDAVKFVCSLMEKRSP